MGAARLINTHDQLTAAQGGIAIIRIPRSQMMASKWQVYRLDERGIEIMTNPDPDCPWFNHHRQTFIYRGSDILARRLDAEEWVAANLGERGPWARNRMGDYVPLRINQRFPIAKPEPKPRMKPELRDGAWKNT